MRRTLVVLPVGSITAQYLPLVEQMVLKAGALGGSSAKDAPTANTHTDASIQATVFILKA
jgi:hypothetical protein